MLHNYFNYQSNLAGEGRLERGGVKVGGKSVAGYTILCDRFFLRYHKLCKLRDTLQILIVRTPFHCN